MASPPFQTEALGEHGIDACGRSGLGVWIPLREEAATTQLLLERGWAVSPGERYRFATPPGIRITTTALGAAAAGELAAALAEITQSGTQTYAGWVGQFQARSYPCRPKYFFPM